MTNTDDTQRATAHTPEPWTQEYLPYVSSKSTGTEVEIPCYRIHPLDTPEAYICETNEQLGDQVQFANARRIVAAVNACEGISTKALENGVVKELLGSSIKFSEALRTNYSDAQLCLEERDAWRDAIEKAAGRAA